MRAATKLILASAVLALPACNKQPQRSQDQNMSIDNGTIPVNADIEALPPDESSGTSTNELANGSDNPDVTDLNSSGNSY